jgi:hypothetical protein
VGKSGIAVGIVINELILSDACSIVTFLGDGVDELIHHLIGSLLASSDSWMIPGVVDLCEVVQPEFPRVMDIKEFVSETHDVDSF